MLNLNDAVRLSVLMRKHLASVCFSRFRLRRNALAIFVVLRCVLWVTPGLAAEAEDASEADSLNRQVVDLYHAGKYQEAIPIARQLLEITEKINGPEHPSTVGSLNNLAVLYDSMGDYAKAEKAIQLYRKSVRGDTDETTLRFVLRSLHDQVWAPIEKALPAGAKTIVLSPDGELNFISFATLLTAADEFLIEKYSIRYVSSGRDLLRERGASATELLAVFGNPDFGSKAESVAQQAETSSPLAMRSSELRDFGNMSLRALPGTDKECAGLKAQADASGKPIRVFLSADATEAQLREINSPRLLHLATHGFFLPESKDEHRGEEEELGTDRMNLIGDAQKDL